MGSYIVAKSKKTSNGVEILHDRYIDTPRKRKLLEREIQNSEIAARIYELRQEAKLSQEELAELAGTKQSVISRLEDADYKGHSLEMLRRIAAALHCKVQVRIVPEDKHAYA